MSKRGETASSSAPPKQHENLVFIPGKMWSRASPLRRQSQQSCALARSAALPGLAAGAN